MLILLFVVRGAFSARGPDSSVGGVPVGYCPDDGHMEEQVQLKVQVEEERIGEKHGKEQGEEQCGRLVLGQGAKVLSGVAPHPGR